MCASAGAHTDHTKMDAQRALLDELMGAERDVPLTQRSNRQLHFTDPGVCKFELAGVCPNQLFTNTRSDLGAWLVFGA